MIREIKWRNHPILGNLKLSFEKSDGSLYNTIILAGENGTGKTTIMETLSTFLNLGSIAPFEYLRYDLAGTTYQITPSPNETYTHFGFHTRKNESTEISSTINNGNSTNRDKLDNDPLDIRYYGCAYSKARSGFKTKEVKSTKTTQLDENKYDSDSSDDFTEIKQLIVDITSQDNAAWAKSCRNGEGLSYSDFLLSSKMHRFESAFNGFFNDISFTEVDEESAEEKRILFAKHGRKITIDQLSTGEKQIVFRGAHLLKNSYSLNGGTILIDEPELSMHPKWQDNILQYYRDLFTNCGTQTAQMFFATHSEYVIRSALLDPDNVLIIILKDNQGCIEINRLSDRVLPIISPSETNYLAFGIESIDYHISLYGRLQSISGKHRIAEIDQYISTQIEYNPTIHERIDNSSYGNYITLPTYIRNAIDHPDSGRTYSPNDLSTSIKLLRKLCVPYTI